MPKRVRIVAAILLTISAAPSAVAGTITLRGEVPTICEMRYDFSGGLTTTDAGLTIFCNAADGARLSAVLIDGDSGGYMVTGAGSSTLAMPGMEFDIRTYNTAFQGRENIHIAQVSGGAPIVPTIVFQIIPEG